MKISVAEFKSGIDHYLELAGEEEIIITKDGEYFAKIVPASKGFSEYLTSLQGILPDFATVEQGREERINKYEGDA